MAERFFPLDSGSAAWGSTMSQAWDVTQAETASGRRRAICNQVFPKTTFNLSFPALSDADVNKLLGFYSKCKGTLLPFWYKDYGSRVEMRKIYRNSDGVYQCYTDQGGYILACEYVDNVRIYVDNTETLDFTVNGGLVNVPGAKPASVVTACYDYYWRVRFDGNLSVTQTFADINSVSVKLVTVR